MIYLKLTFYLNKMDQQLKQLAYISYSQNFSWQVLFTKPLRYVIQFFSGKDYVYKKSWCHSAVFFDGKVVDMTGKGFRLTNLDEWKQEHYVKGLEIYAWNLTKELLPEQESKVREEIATLLQDPLHYNALDAAISAIDNSVIKSKAHNKFCSSVAESLFIAGSCLKRRSNDTNSTPTELINRLTGYKVIDTEQRLIEL